MQFQRVDLSRFRQIYGDGLNRYVIVALQLLCECRQAVRTAGDNDQVMPVLGQPLGKRSTQSRRCSGDQCAGR